MSHRDYRDELDRYGLSPGRKAALAGELRARAADSAEAPSDSAAPSDGDRLSRPFMPVDAAPPMPRRRTDRRMAGLAASAAAVLLVGAVALIGLFQPFAPLLAPGGTEGSMTDESAPADTRNTGPDATGEPSDGQATGSSDAVASTGAATSGPASLPTDDRPVPTDPPAASFTFDNNDPLAWLRIPDALYVPITLEQAKAIFFALEDIYSVLPYGGEFVGPDHDGAVFRFSRRMASDDDDFAKYYTIEEDYAQGVMRLQLYTPGTEERKTLAEKPFHMKYTSDDIQFRYAQLLYPLSIISPAKVDEILAAGRVAPFLGASLQHSLLWNDGQLYAYWFTLTDKRKVYIFEDYTNRKMYAYYYKSLDYDPARMYRDYDREAPLHKDAVPPETRSE